MNLKKAFYQAVMVAWMVLLFGAVIYVDLGYAEPWLSISDVPGGSVGGFAGAIVAAVGGKSSAPASSDSSGPGGGRSAGRRVSVRPATTGVRAERN